MRLSTRESTPRTCCISFSSWTVPRAMQLPAAGSRPYLGFDTDMCYEARANRGPESKRGFKVAQVLLDSLKITKTCNY